MTPPAVSIDDYEEIAKKQLTKQAYDYYRWLILPRMLRGVTEVDTRCSLLGGRIQLPLPIGVAPTASQRMAHADGEEATARAAEALGALMITSTIATTPLETVAAAAPLTRRWFQLYVYADRDATRRLVKRAETAGFEAIVLTVDTPVVGRRRDDLRNAFSLPPHLTIANFSAEETRAATMKGSEGASGFQAYAAALFDRSLCWRDVEWLRSITRLPVVVKGVLTREDALLAHRHGAAAVIVSNHGARQLDSVPATLEVLAGIAETLRGKCDVYLDGGVRTGEDVFKAIALGAKAVFVGRPILWGLAAAGESGVRSVLGILKEEFELTMMLAGCRDLSEVTSEMVCHQSRFIPPAKL